MTQLPRRPHLKGDGTLTRDDLGLMSSPELSITDALRVIAALGESDTLTQASTLLMQARNLVADYVESQN